MFMVWQKNYGAPGTAPGTLALPPDAAPHVLVTAVHYTAEDYTETQVTDLQTYLQTAPQHGVFWFNVDGLGDIQVIETLGAHFHLHPPIERSHRLENMDPSALCQRGEALSTLPRTPQQFLRRVPDIWA
jgi:hypothetical protein